MPLCSEIACRIRAKSPAENPEIRRQAQSHGTIRNAAVIQPIPVHSDIASRVSTTRETVARVLNDLARKGIVERTRNALLIRNVHLLHSMVQEVRG